MREQEIEIERDQDIFLTYNMQLSALHENSCLPQTVGHAVPRLLFPTQENRFEHETKNDISTEINWNLE